MEYGTGNSKRYINITKLHTGLEPSLCTSLPAFHALTGCDYNSSFFQKRKIRPFKLLTKNLIYQKALADLGVAHVTGTRDEFFETLEEFVCDIYGTKNLLNTARFQTFCRNYKSNKKNESFKKILKKCDPSTLPPSKAELRQHLLRTQYITSIWRNADLQVPSSLTPNGNGLILNMDNLDFNWFEGDCLPQSVYDAIVHQRTKENFRYMAEGKLTYMFFL
uniref:Uncharacterized protein LOC114333177 n=1 Tax=Diabrotica virgifera virgifera TaxID=50390 RepID=A0A6P7FR59_DIAVI